jgi:nucleoside triphosphate pyrophosphatase
MAGSGYKNPFILASASPTRAKILENAGLVFDVEPAQIDESAIKSGGLGAAATAKKLALEKALVVAARHPGSLILGADQVMEFGDELISKAPDLDQLRCQLKKLRGKKHALISALAFVENDQIRFEYSDRACLTMHDFSDAFLDDYLEQAGPEIITFVGGYQLEKSGARLFSRTEGDYFTILGLPLLPVLGYLRSSGQIGV